MLKSESVLSWDEIVRTEACYILLFATSNRYKNIIDIWQNNKKHKNNLDKNDLFYQEYAV